MPVDVDEPDADSVPDEPDEPDALDWPDAPDEPDAPDWPDEPDSVAEVDGVVCCVGAVGALSLGG